MGHYFLDTQYGQGPNGNYPEKDPDHKNRLSLKKKPFRKTGFVSNLLKFTFLFLVDKKESVFVGILDLDNKIGYGSVLF